MTTTINLKNKEKKAEQEMMAAVRSTYLLTNRQLREEIHEFYDSYETEEVGYGEAQKYGRFDKLDNRIIGVIAYLAIRNRKTIYKGLANVYNNIFGYVDTKVDAGVKPVPIKESIESPLAGIKLSKRLQRNRDLLITQIQQELTQGMATKKKEREIIKIVAEKLDGDYNKAKRIVETETHRVKCKAANDYYDGIKTSKFKVWVAVTDDRTRDSHLSMNGQQADENGLFHSPYGGAAEYPGGFGIAEEDIHCRCELQIIIP